MFIRINLFFLVLLVVGIVAGCKKSTITEPPPVIAVKSIAGYISSSTTVNQGDSVKIAWVAIRGAQNMTTCEVTTAPGVNLIEFNGGKAKDLQGNEAVAYTDSFKLKAIATRTYTIRVQSANGSAVHAVTIIVPPNIKSYDNVSLTNTNDFFSSSEGIVYGSGEFDANNEKIDITAAVIRDTVYLLSSARRSLEGLTTGINGTITYFRESKSTFGTAQAKDVNNVNTSGGKQKIKIKNKQTYEFVNALGQKGLIHVDTIIPWNGSAFSIEMKVKVQE